MGKSIRGCRFRVFQAILGPRSPQAQLFTLVGPFYVVVEKTGFGKSGHEHDHNEQELTFSGEMNRLDVYKLTPNKRESEVPGAISSFI